MNSNLVLVYIIKFLLIKFIQWPGTPHFPRVILQVGNKVKIDLKIVLDLGCRAAHSCDKVGNFLYIFGGWNGKKALNDLYVLDLDKLIW